MENLEISTSWDYRTANTKLYTHCYHSYPAMMIPQVAGRLIAEYGKNARMLFDPYCGTGTSLVEANLRNINAIGTDLNPLARLIAEMKTTIIELNVLDLFLKKLSDFLFQFQSGMNKSDIIIPNFKNIDFWFSKNVQEKLAAVKQFSDNIDDTVVRGFFYVAFSETVRETSFTRNNEFKLYRMTEKQRERFVPNVFAIFEEKLTRNIKGLSDYIGKMKHNNSSTRVFDLNTVETIIELPKESIDIVVTSPPYGDSRTTVAYGQFSSLSNQWLGFNSANQIDKQLMGGKIYEIRKINIDIADEIVEKVLNQDEKRGKEVYSFYRDFYHSIENVSKLLKGGGYACYVVGNRRVKGITLPTDQITRAFFAAHGFSHECTFTRNIPNKRMPSRNSPTNNVGKTEPTMNHEYIVVMRKH